MSASLARVMLVTPAALDGMPPPARQRGREEAPRARLRGCALAMPPIGQANADVADRLPHLAKLRADVAAARGPLAYVALRKVWAEWDRGDPAEVEEVLHEVAVDAAEPPPTRAYAALLEAYARRRRGDLDGARTRIAALGYVGKWMLVGPVRQRRQGGASRRAVRSGEGARAAARPHARLRRQGPQAGALADAARGLAVRVDRLRRLRPPRRADVQLRRRRSSATRKLKGARDARRLGVGRRDRGAARLLERRRDPARRKYRDLDSDRFAATATLRAGWNRVTAKVCGDERAPMVSLRVAAADGAPDADIEVERGPAALDAGGRRGGGRSARVSSSARAASRGRRRPSSGWRKSEDPATLEAFARYLGATGSDDPTEHRARELARKAADKAPTVERLLLAGELAESRNQRADWIAKAEAIVARGGRDPGARRIDVLLARAAYARSGVNWRDAVPVLREGPRARPGQRGGDAREGRALRGGGPPRHGARAAAARARAAAAQRGAPAGDGGGAARRGSRDGGRRGGGALRGACASTTRPSRARGSSSRWRGATRRRRRAGSTGSSRRTRTARARCRRRRRRGCASASGRAPSRPTARRSTSRPRTPTSCASSRRSTRSAAQRDEQLRLLKRVLELSPQAKDVREQVAHIEPAEPRPDEQYARPASEFLAKRGAPGGRAGAADARRPAGDDGLPERPREPLPPGRLPAADRRGGGRGARVRVRLRDRQRDGAGARRARLPEGRQRSTRPSRAAPARWPTTRRWRCTRARAPTTSTSRASSRATSSSSSTASRTSRSATPSPTTSARSSTCRAPSRWRASEYVLITPKSRTLYFNEPRVPGPAADGGGARRPAHLPLRRARRPGRCSRRRSSRRGRRCSATCTSRPTSRGRRWGAGTGASSRTSSSPTTRSAAAPRR